MNARIKTAGEYMESVDDRLRYLNLHARRIQNEERVTKFVAAVFLGLVVGILFMFLPSINDGSAFKHAFDFLK